jgi:hypothetical protein
LELRSETESVNDIIREPDRRSPRQRLLLCNLDLDIQRWKKNIETTGVL